MRIEFDNLTCRSVLGDSARMMTPRTTLEGFHDPVPVAECPEVLYLPSVLDRGQSICLVGGDTVPLESILYPETLDFVKARRTRFPTAARYEAGFEPVRSDRRVVILGNVFSRNFGHWMEEMLKAAVAESLGLDCDFALAGMPAFAPAFLMALGIARERIIQPKGPVLFRSAFFTPAVSYDTIADFPFAAAALRRMLLGPLGDRRSPYSRRLWLERGEKVNNGGMTLNSEEVHAVVRAHGFDILDMAALSAQDQLVAVKDAEVIAGPHGAQFAHVLYLPPRSTVIECFSPIHVNPTHLATCRLLGHSYHQIVARSHLIQPYAHKRDLDIDLEHLSLILDSLFSGLLPLVPAIGPEPATAAPPPRGWRARFRDIGRGG